MCGIYSYFGEKTLDVENKGNYEKIKLRGPDETVMHKLDDGICVFHRLAINDIGDGQQPFVFGNYTLLCNGEIYNHKELSKQYNITTKSKSDCEIIIHLYELLGIEHTVRLLDGEFAFILIDNKEKVTHFARDYIGIKPLYYREVIKDSKTIELELSSNIKGMYDNTDVQHVLPGTIYTYDRTFNILCSQKYKCLTYLPMSADNDIFKALQVAVTKRITNSDREVGFFLSGGIDSCTVLSIAMKSQLLKYPVNVYTFGFNENAPDAVAAKKMITWLKEKYGDESINWHLVIDSVENGIKTLPEVINVLETYDTTTIRASTPMYMLSKYISEKTPNVKVLLSGEGSDELFGGYLYNKYCPNVWSFRSEIINALNNLYVYDVLRADRVTADCGLEVRPPFLDYNLVNTVLSSNNLTHETSDTKQLLRDILKTNNVLPDVILYSRKEAFSDAVGLNWQDAIAEYSVLYKNKNQNEKIKYSNPTEFFFRDVFYKLYKDMFHILPKLWLPNQSWVFTGNEPSARALSVY